LVQKYTDALSAGADRDVVLELAGVEAVGAVTALLTFVLSEIVAEAVPAGACVDAVATPLVQAVSLALQKAVAASGQITAEWQMPSVEDQAISIASCALDAVETVATAGLSRIIKLPKIALTVTSIILDAKWLSDAELDARTHDAFQRIPGIERDPEPPTEPEPEPPPATEPEPEPPPATEPEPEPPPVPGSYAGSAACRADIVGYDYGIRTGSNYNYQWRLYVASQEYYRDWIYDSGIASGTYAVTFSADDMCPDGYHCGVIEFFPSAGQPEPGTNWWRDIEHRWPFLYHANVVPTCVVRAFSLVESSPVCYSLRNFGIYSSGTQIRIIGGLGAGYPCS
jgi:hypothetical protein